MFCFLTAYVLRNLSLAKLKTEEQEYKQKTSSKSYETR